MKHEVDQITKPYAKSAMISGILCLLLFLMHFGLYSRPSDEDLSAGHDDAPRPVGYDSR